MSPEPLPMCPPGATVSRPKGVAARRRLAKLFRALSDPTRLEILALIASHPEPVCVCEITPCFDVSQPTISHHLKVLREAHLVCAERRGTWSYYSVDPRGAEAVRAGVRHLLPSVPAGTA